MCIQSLAFCKVLHGLKIKRAFICISMHIYISCPVTMREKFIIDKTVFQGSPTPGLGTSGSP